MPAQLILQLHGIGSPHGGVTEDGRFYWLSRETFVSLLETIVMTREGSDLPVAITFDDGNESDVLIALPELAKRNLKAIFFVVGERIGMPHYLDRVALRDLVSAGMEIGSLGMHYCDWRKARLDDATCRSSCRRPPHRGSLWEGCNESWNSLWIIRPPCTEAIAR
jgi:hypothetical protein